LRPPGDDAERAERPPGLPLGHLPASAPIELDAIADMLERQMLRGRRPTLDAKLNRELIREAFDTGMATDPDDMPGFKGLAMKKKAYIIKKLAEHWRVTRKMIRDALRETDPHREP